MYNLGSRSRSRLEGVHPALVRCVETAITITGVDFTVLEGLRSEARQRTLFAQGHTRTLNSRHITGHAVDLAPWINGSIPWDDHMAFRCIGHAMLRAAEIHGVAVTWGALKSHGGMWRTFNDMPHYQVSRDLSWN